LHKNEMSLTLRALHNRVSYRHWRTRRDVCAKSYGGHENYWTMHAPYIIVRDKE